MLDALETDIGFVLFTSPAKPCDDLEAIRCMFTGANVPEPSDPISSGPTGLSPNSTDTVEEPGCLKGGDNFLAPAEVNAGDVLYLAIIESTPKSHQCQKCFFWRHFHFTQLADAQASPNLVKCKFQPK